MHLEQDRAALEDLRSWLSQTNSGAQQSDIIRRRHEGTGQWFLDAPEFTAWLRGTNNSGTLFCTGIPGAGKTMIAALAIEHLTTKVQSDTIGVTWAYCSYKSQNEQTVRALLATILQQLVQADNPQGVQVLEKLRKKHAANGTTPNADELRQSLQALIAGFSTTFIVIDALDECSASDDTRGQFLAHIRALHTNADVRLMVTSRQVPDIVDEFTNATRLEIRAHTEDVEKYLAGQLVRLPRCIQRDAELQKVVRVKITEAMDGM
jgi:Cdc6-like AAA superfamily ATPase